MFEADLPIVKASQDRLGRQVFAKYLARCILDHTNPESLVMGLYGGFGVGKTSLINLTLEELATASSNLFDHQKPIILNFNPWSYSSQTSPLVTCFFRQLSFQIKQSSFVENAERIIHLLELYISFFTHKPVPKTLRQKRSLRARLSKNKEIHGWESGRDLLSIKNELNELLRHQEHKIIIVLDDLTQLEDLELKQIFQLVKSIGDFANTVYLLSMDKSLVIEAMNRVYGNNGKEFIQKIIQLSFDVPPMARQELNDILLDKLKKIVETAPAGSWNSKYWADLYYSSLKHFFKHARDITRYVNTLGFSFFHVKEIVNPVDFFAMTALEVFEPAVYDCIRENKDLFTDLFNQAYPADLEKITKDKLRCDEIIARVKHIPPDLLRQLMTYLFPRLRHLYHSHLIFYHSEASARDQNRVCSPDLFDIYFRLSLSKNRLPDTELEAILSLTSLPDQFDHALSKLNQDDRIHSFLYLLDGLHQSKIQLTQIPAIINALMDSADLFKEGETTLLTFNTSTQIHRIFHQLLRRHDKSEKRTELFNQAILKASKSLYVIVHEIELYSQEQEELNRPIEYNDFQPEQLALLKRSALEKINEWANTQRLMAHPKLIDILLAWTTWETENNCLAYLEKTLQNDRDLILFLSSALRVPIDQAMSKLKMNAAWRDYLIALDQVIPSHTLESHAKAIFEHQDFEKLQEREQLAVLIFLNLINAKTKKVFSKITL